MNLKDGSISFVSLPDETVDQIEPVFRAGFKYQIVRTCAVHDYQGSEGYVLAQKCKEALRYRLPGAVVTDVLSIGFNALNGLPGTLITSLEGKLTSGELFKLLEGWEDKSACVTYSLGLLRHKRAKLQVFQHCLPGVMVEPENPNAYGWETCFRPDCNEKIYAELPKDIQIDILGRKKTMLSLRAYVIRRSPKYFCNLGRI